MLPRGISHASEGTWFLHQGKTSHAATAVPHPRLLARHVLPSEGEGGQEAVGGGGAEALKMLFRFFSALFPVVYRWVDEAGGSL